MIDKLSGNVAYAVLSFGGFLGMGQKHLPIPWAKLKSRSHARRLSARSQRRRAAARAAFAADKDFDWGDRGRSDELIDPQGDCLVDEG